MLTEGRWPGSLQRMVRRCWFGVESLTVGFLMLCVRGAVLIRTRRIWTPGQPGGCRRTSSGLDRKGMKGAGL